jgi:hypothetical protein
VAAWFVVHEIVVVVEPVDVAMAEITGGFWTLTVVDAVEVLFDVSVDSAQRVVEPLATIAVFQGIK